jgi:hypothetical protein
VAALLDYRALRLVEMVTARLNPVPACGLRPVQPPRLLHAYRVRQPSFRTMNRYEMPRSGHPQGVPLRDIASPSPCETPRQRRRTSGAKLVIDISARRSRLLGLDSNEQADGGGFWRRQPSASAVADLAAASMLNADVISAMSEAALDLLTQTR